MRKVTNSIFPDVFRELGSVYAYFVYGSSGIPQDLNFVRKTSIAKVIMVKVRYVDTTLTKVVRQVTGYQ